MVSEMMRGREASGGPRRPGLPVALLGLLLALSGPALAGAGQRPVDEGLRTLYAQAESLVRAGDLDLAEEAFTRVIQRLAPVAEAGDIDPEGRLLLARSLAFRADVRLQNGDTRDADDDLERLLTLYPRIRVDGFGLSDDALARFERARGRTVAHLELRVSPSEAELVVDGEVLPEGVTVWPVIAGTHAVAARLPGYSTQRRTVEVDGGARESIEMSLYRVSAVVRFHTSPPGATVRVDGREVGATEGTAGTEFVPTGDVASRPAGDFSSEMVIEGLMPGTHEIEVARDGYRTFRGSVTVDSLADYRVGPIVLTPTTGLLLLRDLPPGATVWLDGDAVEPDPPSAGDPDEPAASSAWRLAVEPGAHRVTVQSENGGVWESTFSMTDQGSRTLSVSVAPGLTYLGVLGGERLAVEAVDDAIVQAFARLQGWTVLDRTAGGADLLAAAGLDADALRRAAADGAETPDWNRAQAVAGDALPGSVFAVGVLVQEGVATHADVWIWPTDPGPARSERVRVALGGSGALEALAERLSGDVAFDGPWFGATLVDGDAADGPVVAAVAPGSPAEQAGLGVGDRLLTVAGNFVGTAANAGAWLDTFPPGDSVVLGVAGPGGESSVDLRVGASPRVVDPADPTLLFPVVWARATLAADRLDGPVPSWVAELNQAAALLRARDYGAAAELLAGVQAPDRPGVGQAMADYWLGVALSMTGDLSAAREALLRAAASPDGRMFHNDGPLVAPRARARLAGLDR